MNDTEMIRYTFYALSVLAGIAIGKLASRYQHVRTTRVTKTSKETS